MDATLRQWAMLRLIPRPPKTISTRDLYERLSDQGYAVSKRTMERDLERMSRVFPLTSERAGHNGLRWGWMPGASLGLPDGRA